MSQTADVEKRAVYDPRMIQPNPVAYAVEKGALSLTSTSFNAIGANASQINFSVNVPSQNVFVDRKFEMEATVLSQMVVTLANTTAVAANITTAQEPVVQFGRDIALCANPLSFLISTLSATINDCTVTANLDQILYEVLRLCDYKMNRVPKTTPCMLDKYQSYNDAYGALNNPLGSYLQSTEAAEVPNGAWWDIDFVGAGGADLVEVGNANWRAAVNGASCVLCFKYGTKFIPVRTPASITGLTLPGGVTQVADPGPYTLFFKWHVVEPLVLSPFIFADAHEWSTGMFGINNISVTATLKSDVSRLIRNATVSGRTVSAVALSNFAASGSPFQGVRLNVQFLTPSLDLAEGLLPTKSAVPYFEFPRYVTANLQAIPANSSVSVQTTNIVLPSIPDMLILYAKPSAGYTNTQGDYYLPITQVSINWDNYSGLLNSFTPTQLHSIAVHNGLNMDYAQWRGYARTANGGIAAQADVSGAGAVEVGNNGGVIQTVGGFLVLKLGQDIVLSSGNAPGLVGNFSFQAQVTIENTSNASVTPVIYTIAVNSGFFESMAGSSRIQKSILSEADILSAPPVEGLTRDSMKRVIGAGMFGNLSSMLGKIMPTVMKGVELYKASKPLGQAVKGMMPEGKLKQVMDMAGYGMTGAAMPAGAGKMGRKSLSQRLM